MSSLTNSHHFSAPAKVSGKARLAGNGCNPWQESQRGQGPWLARPPGAYGKRRHGVASLANITNIPCGTRLVATLAVGSEIMRISQAGH